MFIFTGAAVPICWGVVLVLLGAIVLGYHVVVKLMLYFSAGMA